MATATAMYHSGRNTLRKLHRTPESADETVDIVRGEKRRRLHKAFLRYHDANNWPLLREALKAMGRADLIGNGKQHLIPSWQPLSDGGYTSARKKNSTTVEPKAGTPAPSAKAAPVKPSARVTATAPVKGRILTQHTGLPPRDNGAGRPTSKPAARPARKPR
jgi:hypothetical protein